MVYNRFGATSVWSAALLVFVGTLSTGCASLAPTADIEYGPAEFTLVFLRTDTGSEAAIKGLPQEHLVFMNRLAAQGVLLLSGPFGDDKAEEDLAGILLIDASNFENGRAIGAEDPATQAGVFRQEAVPLTTLEVIRALPSMETARQNRRQSAGEDMTQPDLRAYTILCAPDGPAAAASLLSHPAMGGVVVLMGRMGEPRKDELFAVLDVPTVREARARLKVANQDGLEVTVSEWLGSPVIAELARAGGPPGGQP